MIEFGGCLSLLLIGRMGDRMTACLYGLLKPFVRMKGWIGRMVVWID